MQFGGFSMAYPMVAGGERGRAPMDSSYSSTKVIPRTEPALCATLPHHVTSVPLFSPLFHGVVHCNALKWGIP